MKIVIFSGVVIAGGLLWMTSMQTGLDSRPLRLAGAGTVLNQSRGVSPAALNVPAGSATYVAQQSANQGPINLEETQPQLLATADEGPIDLEKTAPKASVTVAAQDAAVLADANAAGEHMDLSDRQVKVEQALSMTGL
jgi:hypothetical protein